MARSAHEGLLQPGEGDSLRTFVMQSLEDQDPRVRLGAAWSLGQLPGTEESQGALLGLLDDPVLQVRQAVMLSLKADSTLGADPLERSLDHHGGEEEANIRIRRRLIELLASRDPARALARIEQDPALEAERRLLPAGPGR
jgi:HEAT repeat protein